VHTRSASRPAGRRARRCVVYHRHGHHHEDCASRGLDQRGEARVGSKPQAPAGNDRFGVSFIAPPNSGNYFFGVQSDNPSRMSIFSPSQRTAPAASPTPPTGGWGAGPNSSWKPKRAGTRFFRPSYANLGLNMKNPNRKYPKELEGVGGIQSLGGLPPCNRLRCKPCEIFSVNSRNFDLFR